MASRTGGMKTTQKVRDIGLAALFVYECGIECIQRVELFGSSNTFYIQGVPSFDFEIICTDYDDPKAVLSNIKAYAQAFVEVQELKRLAAPSGVWQKKVRIT